MRATPHVPGFYIVHNGEFFEYHSFGFLDTTDSTYKQIFRPSGTSNSLLITIEKFCLTYHLPWSLVSLLSQYKRSMEDDIAQQPKLDDLFAELELGLREAYTKITKTIPAEGADEQTLLDSIPAKHPFHEEYKQRLSGITAHNPYHYYFLISDGALLFTPGADNRLSFSAEHQEQLSQLVIDKTTHQKLLRIQQVIRSKPPSTQPKRPSHLNFAALDGGPAE